MDMFLGGFSAGTQYELERGKIYSVVCSQCKTLSQELGYPR